MTRGAMGEAGSMRYRITHTTVYEYAENVLVSQNQAFLTRRSGGNQRCRGHRLIVHPRPSSMSSRLDYFGNEVAQFTVVQEHRRLRVVSQSLVRVRRRRIPEADSTPAWEMVRDQVQVDTGPRGLDALQHVFASTLVPCSREMADHARPSFPEGRPILAGVLELTSRLKTEFTYEPGATTVHTPVEDAFRRGRGVCQDLAHIQLACLRSLGLPARYVSGYLRTHPPAGETRRVGADASHAWVSVWCGRVGWVDIDPTNDVLVSDEHVTLAWGRDYNDVCPLSGLIVGGGAHTMNISVDVEPLDPPERKSDSGDSSHDRRSAERDQGA